MAAEATFGERLLALLDGASRSTTYKYALLLAILDAVMRRSDPDGGPPEAIPVRALAERVIELYWNQAVPYPATGSVLRQSHTGQAEIVTRIRGLREGIDERPQLTLAEARALAPDRVERLIGDIEWKLVEMPLPRLQRLQGADDPFIYETDWDETVRRADLRRPGFRCEIRLRPGVGRELLQLSTLVRPLVERLWAGQVVAYNRLPEGEIERFLLGADRLAAARIRPTPGAFGRSWRRRAQVVERALVGGAEELLDRSCPAPAPFLRTAVIAPHRTEEPPSRAP
ncbi:MAG: hypothetical protein IPM45_03235 [Acidimicrobiales bacterium]|nr:hypothetical protein [Acidimicrobiales bacterium]